MADVDRGQLILITALAIAVTLVALVLLLNTVIYAENLATRGADVGGQDAVEFRGAAVRGVAGVLDAENRLDYDDPDHVRANVTAGVERIDGLVARQYLQRTELAEISLAGTTDGARLRHPTDVDNFSSADDRSSWTLATDVTATRDFVMTVDRSDVNATDTTEAFRVVLLGSDSNEWVAYVYDDGGITVAVKNGTELLPTEVCEGDGENVTIDFTAGTVDGEPCPGLVFGKGIETPYSMSFTNADRAGGTYDLTVDRDPDVNPAIQSGFNHPSSKVTPYYAYAVYDVTVDVRFQTDALTFEDSVRVAPGEPT